MTGTHIRIGQLAIDGIEHAPSKAGLSRRLQAAIAAALGGPAAGFRTSMALPQLRITLPQGASERDVAAAVASALRDAAARKR